MRPKEISTHQLWTGTLGIMLVAAFYGFPRSAAESASTAAPWAILLAGGTAFLLLLPSVSALSRRPGQNLMDLALDGGGRLLAIFVALVFVADGIVSVGLTLRQASELVVSALYPHTPQTVAMSSMIIISALGAAMAPANAWWLASLYVWPTLFSILLLLVGTAAWGQVRNVLPFTGHGVLPTLSKVFPLTSYFSPLLHLIIFSSFLPSSRRLVRGTALAIAVSTLVGSLVLLLFLMVFPLPGGLDIPFPVFEMSRLVQGGRFLERVDVVWIVAWSFGSVLRTALALLALSLLLKQAFRLPDHRGAVLPLAIPILAVALVPSNQATALEMEAQGRQVGVFVFFVLPLLVTLLAHVRGKRAHGRANRGETRA